MNVRSADDVLGLFVALNRIAFWEKKSVYEKGGALLDLVALYLASLLLSLSVSFV